MLHPEYIQADLLRTLYKLKVIDYETLDKLVDQLTVRLLAKTTSSQ